MKENAKLQTVRRKLVDKNPFMAYSWQVTLEAISYKTERGPFRLAGLSTLHARQHMATTLTSRFYSM